MNTRKFLLAISLALLLGSLTMAQDPAHLSETYGLPSTIDKLSVTVPPGNSKPYKNYNDLAAARLKGKVKTVVTYEQCASGGASSLLLKARDHYDAAGDLVKSFTFDAGFTCDASKVELMSMSHWGYYQNSRTEGRFVNGGMLERASRNVRIITYKFDAQNRPTEISTMIKNVLAEKSTFTYGVNKADEIKTIPSLGDRTFAYNYTYDKDGNLTRQVDGPQRDYTYTKFDAKGNWTARTVIVSFGGKNPMAPVNSVRLIEYYP